MKVLIIDDETRIRNVIKLYLRKEGFSYAEAADGRTALDMLAAEKFDLVILDIMLPELDGWTVCREIRARSDLPVIMLTAREEETDRILGLELGADDYVVKPFSPRELLARIKAVLRRSARGGGGKTGGSSDGTLVFPGLTVNPATRAVEVNGRPVKLTAKEFNLLFLMARNPGRVYTRDELLQAVWGFDYFGDSRTVDTHINRLRDKLDSVPGGKKYIGTVWGVGYKFEVAE